LLRQKGFMPDDSDSEDDYVFGDDDFPSEEEEPSSPLQVLQDGLTAVGEAASAGLDAMTEAVSEAADAVGRASANVTEAMGITSPEIDVSGYDAKLVKAVLKEGGKKAQDVAGVADLGGLDFFCTSIDSAKGDVMLLRAAMDAMNAPCEPDSEERRGGAGHVGKVLVSFSEKTAVAIVCCVPDDKQDKLSAKTWIEHIANAIKADVLYSSAGYAYAEMKYDVDAGKFPLKERDNAISNATLLLRNMNLMPDDDDDSDDYCYGDDDFE